MVRRSAERDAVSPKPRGVCTGIFGGNRGGGKNREKGVASRRIARIARIGMWHVACGLIRSVVVVLANGKRRREG